MEGGKGRRVGGGVCGGAGFVGVGRRIAVASPRTRWSILSTLGVSGAAVLRGGVGRGGKGTKGATVGRGVDGGGLRVGAS